MNNKIIAGVVVLVLLIAGGYYFTKTKNTSNNEVESNTSSVQSDSQETQQTGSLKSLLAGNGNRKCTYKTVQQGYVSEGTFYVANGKMRGDISTTTGGRTTNAHMITKDSTSYMWTDGSDMAFKMAYDPSDVKPSGSTDASASQQAVDLNKDYDFDCSSWSVDASQFELPSGITFKELPKMPAGMPENGVVPSSENNIDSKASAELVCNSLSGDAKQQCLKALQ